MLKKELFWKKKEPWCWDKFSAGGEGDSRGWDGWLASLTQWTWIRATLGVADGQGKPGVLQSMGLQSWTQLSDWTTTALHKGQNLQYLEIAASSHIWIWQHDTWDMTNSHQKIKYEGGFAILSWALKKGVVFLHAELLPSAWWILMPRASITLSDSMG